MTPPPPAPALTPVPALLTADQERALAAAIRAGRRARLLAQRHLAARLRRDLPPTTSARAAAGAVLATLTPGLPLAPAAIPAVAARALQGVLDDLAAVARALDGWPLDQDARAAGHAARVTFVAANRGLVHAVALRYQHRGLPLDDLVQEGTVGLLRAVDLFDPARGVGATLKIRSAALASACRWPWRAACAPRRPRAACRIAATSPTCSASR